MQAYAGIVAETFTYGDRDQGLVWVFETSKLTPRDIFSSSKPTPSNSSISYNQFLSLATKHSKK